MSRYISSRNGNGKGSSTKVLLNVYDLMDNQYLYPLGLGAYHSGVQIGSREYTYAGGMGVYTMEPLSAPNAKFRETIELGEYTGTTKQFECILDELRTRFQPNEYNVLTKNCNCFADCLVEKLLHKNIPAYVNRLAGFGNMVSCCLPPEMSGQPGAPDTDSPTNSSSSSSSTRGGAVTHNGNSTNMQSNPLRPSPAATSASGLTVFTGAGHKLGGNSTSSGSGAAVYKNPYRDASPPVTGVSVPMKKMTVA